jgi:hypothetical protein
MPLDRRPASINFKYSRARSAVGNLFGSVDVMSRYSRLRDHRRLSTAALVCRPGSIDRLCISGFGSISVFAAIDDWRLI